jgi:hypothetical protein
VEGLLWCAASVGVLVGLGALVEATYPRQRGQGGRRRSISVNATSAAILRRCLLRDAYGGGGG